MIDSLADDRPAEEISTAGPSRRPDRMDWLNAVPFRLTHMSRLSGGYDEADSRNNEQDVTAGIMRWPGGVKVA